MKQRDWQAQKHCPRECHVLELKLPARASNASRAQVDKASNIARQIGNGCWRKKVVLCSCFAKERGLQGPPSQRSCLSISGRLVWGWRQLGAKPERGELATACSPGLQVMAGAFRGQLAKSARLPQESGKNLAIVWQDVKRLLRCQRAAEEHPTRVD